MSNHAVRLLVYLIGLTSTMQANGELGSSPAFQSNSVIQVTVTHANRTHSNVPYVLYVTTLETGVTVKEFASQSGNVFAVSWIAERLQAAPVDRLLGAYFSCYQQAIESAGAQSSMRGDVLDIEQSGLSIHVEHTKERIFGRVYLRQALPPGLEEAVIN